MRRIGLVVAALAVAGVGGVAGWFLADAVRGTETETLTTTVTTITSVWKRW